MRESSWRIRVWMRVSSADNSTVALALVLLPFGRPGLRFGAAWAFGVAPVLVRSAAFSSAVRSTCSSAIGNDRRCEVLIKERVKKATEGTLLPYREAKKRSRP